MGPMREVGSRLLRSRATSVILLVSLSLLAACSGGGDKSAANPKKNATVSTTTTTAPPPPIAPETGLPDPGGQSLTRPALWAKLENTPDARPQAGLATADVVYEQVTEGDITRFIALFNSQIPDVIGPIRSVREMDPDVVSPLGGVFAYSGGIPTTVALIEAAPVNAVDEDKAGTAMFRDNTKFAPHNLYGHAAQLLALGGKPVPIVPLFRYTGAAEKFSGDPVLSVNVGFPSGYAVDYAYDAASNTWKRSMAGVPFVDTSGAQVAPTNVIVQFVGCCIGQFEGARVPDRGFGRGVDLFERANSSRARGSDRRRRRSPSSPTRPVSRSR